MDLSPEMNNVMIMAVEVMRRCNADALSIDHVAVALITGSASVGRIVDSLKESSVDVADQIIQNMPQTRRMALLNDNVQATPQVMSALIHASQEAARLGASQIAPVHVFLALFSAGDSLSLRTLQRVGVTEERVRQEIARHLETKEECGLSKEERDTLDRFTVDFTDLAGAGKLDPLVGRERELELVVTTLVRRTKNNPALIGEPGVGKTAIVEGLAQLSVEGKLPACLANRRIRSLNWTALTAGTALRGSFEERLDAIMRAVKKEGCVLFIDEMHLLLGAGASIGGMNAANLLKPSLARGDVLVIGATTADEYRKHIERDPALERRFTPIFVEELGRDAVLQALRAVRPRYEQHHGVVVTDEALEAAVALSERYLPERRMPDKVIDVLDEACAHCRVKTEGEPQDHALDHWEREERDALERGDYARASYARAQRLRAANDASRERRTDAPRVTDQTIAAVLSRRLNVPIGDILETERERLQTLEACMRERVVGQDHVIAPLADAIMRIRLGVRDDHRPVSFLFVGPPGVGKTEMARALSYALFRDETALLRIDMTEFQEPHSLSRLIGAPPGYVGYDDSLQLIERVRRRPFQVILLDEMDKAHPNVARSLLQAIGDGRLTDGHGRTVSLRDVVVIMTSNAGAEAASETTFGLAPEGRERHRSSAGVDAITRRARHALRDAFPPEFLDRIDYIALFRSLDVDSLQTIVSRRLESLAQRIQRDHRIIVDFDESVAPFLVRFRSDANGARDVIRAIQDHIETPLARALLQRPADSAIISVAADERDGLRLEWTRSMPYVAPALALPEPSSLALPDAPARPRRTR